jgi:capsular exopolysaccharide synthesis family protein
MSRIFEALQRSESERVGVSFPQSASLPTELLQAAEKSTDDLAEFPSLRVAVSPGCRLVSLTNKESLGAEKFRFLGVRLRQLQQSRPLKKVLVTSTIAEEGKSLVSANLAVTLARKKQQRILLMDGDLRRPVLAQQFGLGRLAGVCEWLKGDTRPVTNLYYLEGAGFWFMPAGTPPENPLELMQTGRLSELLDQLSHWFDWIVIDSPPVLPLADTTVWARLADGILLVAREGKTEKKALQQGMQALEQSNLLGVVFNSCSNTDHSNYYQRYGTSAKEPKNGTGTIAPTSDSK